ncbi:MAG TPA: aldehyde dehydrogenase family protein [Bacteroidota bacterium]|nr:aldehyde dehydrogenase family protein [Bacteroidota bacterium]HLE34020.1 aldehyde dehydrogenase family protein [Bacteroidota bacterium]
MVSTSMKSFSVPDTVNNIVGGRELPPQSGKYFEKLNPHDGRVICRVARSGAEDVQAAVRTAKEAQVMWADTPPVKRGELLFAVAQNLKRHQEDVARIVALETGKSFKDAMGETSGAVALGMFMAGEGQRLYGKTTTSAVPHKHAIIVREPVGIAGLIIAANTPIANVAWKVFPALVCGNAAILKSSEDTPLTSWIFGKIAYEAGLPEGVLSIVQGYGEEAGAPLVEHPDVNLISFTGSSIVGKYIGRVAGERLAKVCLELGGKNPLVVCDDADLENAVKWVLLSAFSNAGQRCAAGSRIIVFEKIWKQFTEMLVAKTSQLKIGPTDSDDFGPVINLEQLNNMLAVVERGKQLGAKVLAGGKRLLDESHKNGFYMAPTLIECTNSSDELSSTELFGPVTCLYRVKDFSEALKLANASAYGLTASIHTTNVNRALEFVHRVQAGVAVINGGTYGSEPHMPFGGVKQSGNGMREPGTEALDIYSNIKVIYQISDPTKV